jgi:hypothetical protein
MDEQDNTPQPIHYEATLPAKASLAGHNWVQRGPFLSCMSCPFEHSQHIPAHLIYKGLDNQGMPILEPVK